MYSKNKIGLRPQKGVTMYTVTVNGTIWLVILCQPLKFSSLNVITVHTSNKQVEIMILGVNTRENSK